MADYKQDMSASGVILSSQLSDCVRCGACRAVCPTFSVARREYASARGKVSLCDAFRQGEFGLSQKFIKAVKECLTCAACRENCPNNVDVPSIILATRSEIVRGKGMPLHHLLLKRALALNPLNPVAFRTVSLMEDLFLKDVPGYSGLHTRFPIPFIDKDRLLPPLADKTFLESIGSGLKRESKNEDNNPESFRVGLFIGCLINYILPGIGEATVNLLKREGISVMLPEGQRCCGMPAVGMGDRDTAKDLALKNIEGFEEYDLDFIVTSCATCASALKLHYRELFKEDDEEIKGRVESFCSKVREVTEFLVRELRFSSRYPVVSSQYSVASSKVEGQTIRSSVRHDDTGNASGMATMRVTYHDPCHMSRYLRIKDEPREIIESSGYVFKEMSHPCRCCGLGGIFNLDYYEMSKRIGRDKAEDIENTGADIVATACPGCIIQIRDALHHMGVRKEVVHVVELLDRSQGIKD